jgi:hypothetical protein
VKNFTTDVKSTVPNPAPERRVMLIKLPNGDLIDGADVVGVQALEAVSIPDRVEVALADDTVIAIPATDLEDAASLRDVIVAGLDDAGELVLEVAAGVSDDDEDRVGGLLGCNGACAGCTAATCDGYRGDDDADDGPGAAVVDAAITAPSGCGDRRCPCCNPAAVD